VTSHPAIVRGFTLIEILVAMAVFAVLSALAYGTLSQTITGAEVLSSRMERLEAIQRTMRIIGRDFLQLAPRPVRDELGDGYDPALTTAFGGGFAVELTRGGWTNPMTLARGTQQRAAYRLEGEELIRVHWNVLDHTLSNELIEVRLLDGVESVSFLFMQENGEWTEQWPPPGRDGPLGLRIRPRAVQIILRLIDEGELTRIIEVAP
jgi:general secretion pathway protein J